MSAYLGTPDSLSGPPASAFCSNRTVKLAAQPAVSWNGWGAGPPPEGVERLRHQLARMQGLRAFLPFRIWIHRGLSVH